MTETPANGDNKPLQELSCTPESLEDLATLLVDIKANNSPIKLGRSALKVLSEMVANPNQASLYSISHLASEFEVNASTLTRLAKTLGFSGFSEFQEIFKNYTAKTTAFYSNRVNQLFTNEDGHEGLDIASKIANEESNNIAAMLSGIKAETLDAVVEVVHHAKRVRTHGRRQSSTISGYLSYGLGLIRKDVSILGTGEQGIVHGISQLSANDVLFVVSSSPYTRSTIMASRLAKKQGITVIAVTDNYSSPLVECADHTFITPTTGTFFSNSMGSSVVLVEVLLSLFAQRLGDAALESLKHYEQLVEEMQVEL